MYCAAIFFALWAEQRQPIERHKRHQPFKPRNGEAIKTEKPSNAAGIETQKRRRHSNGFSPSNSTGKKNI